MKELSPAFQFYPRDFITETFAMSAEQAGIYIWLISFCWMDGAIPIDDSELARICKVPQETMARAFDTMRHLFAGSEHSGWLIHRGVEAERARQATLRQERSQSGKRGAKKRWQEDSGAMFLPMANDASSSSSSTASSIKHKTPLCEPKTVRTEYGPSPLAGKSPYTPRWYEQQHDRFYRSYWRRVGRKDSFRAFESRVKKLTKTGLAHEQAVEFLIARALEDRARFEATDEWSWRQKLHPATWLNGERWLDEAPSPKQPPKDDYENPYHEVR